MLIHGDKELFSFLSNAPKLFKDKERIKKYQLKNGDHIHCVLWNMHFYITGTDIVKILIWRFQNAGRTLSSLKKFEEGIFSDLRNLKPGIDATLEGPRSEFLEFLYKNGCIRTQKKQKVFYWYSVPHDALFCDALERDLRRETNLYTYNKYINNLARTNISYSGHTRTNTKRYASDIESRVFTGPENFEQAKSFMGPYSQMLTPENHEYFDSHEGNVKFNSTQNILPNEPDFQSPFDFTPQSNFSLKDQLFPSKKNKVQPEFNHFKQNSDSFVHNDGILYRNTSRKPNKLIPERKSGRVYAENSFKDLSFEDFDFLKERVEKRKAEEELKKDIVDKNSFSDNSVSE